MTGFVMKALLAGAVVLGMFAGSAQAATLGLDAASKALIGDFTASFVATGDLNFGTASGTTNGGVTWSTNINHYLPYSNGTGSGNIGTGAGNTAPQAANDWIHSGAAFTLTFSESISAILFSVSDNDVADNQIIDLGVAPTLDPVSPGGLSVSGTAVSIITKSGGYVLYTGLSGTTFTSGAHSTDGSNYAFAVLTTADAVVPVPAGLPLALAGFGALAALRRRTV